EEALRVEAAHRILAPVVREERLATDADLAVDVGAERGARLRGADAQLTTCNRRPVVPGAELERRIPRPRGAQRRRLRHPVRPDGVMIGRVEPRRPARVRADAFAEMEPGRRE